MTTNPTLAERILALPCLGTMSQFATLDDLKLYQSAFKEGLAQAAALAAEQEGQEPVAWMIQDAADVEIPGTGTCKFSRDNPADYGYGASNVTPLYASRAAQEGDAKWISVNDERKPEPGQVILVYAFSLTHGEDDEGNYRANETEEVAMGEYRRTTANGTDYHFDCFTFPNGDVDSISHWMPLPDAPASTTNQKG